MDVCLGSWHTIRKVKKLFRVPRTRAETEGMNAFAINMTRKAAGIYFLRLADDMGHIYVKQLMQE